MRWRPTATFWESVAASVLAWAITSAFVAFLSFLAARGVIAPGFLPAPVLYILTGMFLAVPLLATYAWIWEWRHGKTVKSLAAAYGEVVTVVLADLDASQNHILRSLASGMKALPTDLDVLSLVNAHLIEARGRGAKLGELIYRLHPASEAAIRKHLGMPLT
jgi:hypothetical protein